MMTVLALKKSIHERVDNLNDLETLDKIISSKDELFVIPDEHLADIIKGEQDIKNGDFLTIEELEKRYEKWLS